MDPLTKKSKRASVSFSQLDGVDGESKAKLKYQQLLEEHLELQKEFVSRKKKLQAAKEKKKTILAEVRFLRQRCKYLSRTRFPESYAEAAPRNLDHISNSIKVLQKNEAVGDGGVQEDGIKLNKKLKNRIIANRRPTSIGRIEVAKDLTQ